MKALLSALPLTVSQMEGGELGFPINLTALATIQGVSGELNVTSQNIYFPTQGHFDGLKQGFSDNRCP